MTTATAVRERPILFSGDMVRAILAGTKTQTRRVVLPSRGRQALWLDPALLLRAAASRICRAVGLEGLGAQFDHPKGGPLTWIRSPYGQPGDRLWVRESFSACACGGCQAVYPARGPHGVYAYRASEPHPDLIFRPSIHMPRWASRLTLEITEVRVERVQAISEADAVAEGAPPPSAFREPLPIFIDGDFKDADCRRDVFSALWNGINRKRGFGWEANPWVWAITFRRVETEAAG